MSNIDALSVAVRRYLIRTAPPYDSNLCQVTFTGFKPSQDSNTLTAQLLGQTPDGRWYYSNICIRKEDLIVGTSMSIFQLIQDRVDLAVIELNRMVEEYDPFDEWVKETRRANGISDPAR